MRVWTILNCTDVFTCLRKPVNNIVIKFFINFYRSISNTHLYYLSKYVAARPMKPAIAAPRTAFPLLNLPLRPITIIYTTPNPVPTPNTSKEETKRNKNIHQ